MHNTLVAQEQSAVQQMYLCLALSRELEATATQLDRALADNNVQTQLADESYNKRILELDTEKVSCELAIDASVATIQRLVRDKYDQLSLPAPSAATALPTPVGSPEHILSNLNDTSAKAQRIRSFQRGIPAVFGSIVSFGGCAMIVIGVVALVLWPLTLAALVLLGVAYVVCSIMLNTVVHELNFAAHQVVEGGRLGRERDIQNLNARIQSDKQLAAEEWNSLQLKHKTSRDAVYKQLMEQMQRLRSEISAKIDQLDRGLVCGDWTDSAWKGWQATDRAPSCLRIGTLTPSLPRFQHYSPECPAIRIPALIEYAGGKGLMIYTGGNPVAAREMVQGSIFRLLSTVPPSNVRFVMIDPVSLGGSVAGFMALEAYEPSLVGGKVWSDSRHIEQALAEITEHMETVIQKYLREDYETIADYNAKARVKEAYRVVVAFDFPVNFSDTSAKRLVSIIRNGPRCGVFPILVVDDTKPLPYGVELKDFEQFALVIRPVSNSHC